MSIEDLEIPSAIDQGQQDLGLPQAISRRRRAVRWLAADKAATIALAYLLLLIAAALLAPVIAPYPPDQQDLLDRFARPSSAHWLGTDDLGRDVLSRMLYGARLSLQASFQSVGVALLIAVPLGLLTGYRGGRIDQFVMRLLDIQLALPALILVIAIASALGGGLTNTMLALSVAFIPSLTRLVRAETLAVRHETYVEASHSIGSSTPRILRTRVLRNISPVLIVQIAITLGVALVAEAALSFIGLGALPPAASWGSILRNAYNFIIPHPWGVLPSAIAITVTAFAFNVLGDSLRDVLGIGERAAATRGIRVMTQVSRTSAPESEAGSSTDEPPAPLATPAVTADESEDLLVVDSLSVDVRTPERDLPIIDDIDLSVAPGEVLGIVGESGSGKTVTAMTLTRLMPSPPARVTSGSVAFKDRDLLQASASELQSVRGRDVAMIFQNPRASLNPALTVGTQIEEVLRWHIDLSSRDARAEAARLLERVGVPASRIDDYPHQLSGGMCQRVMIAMSIACKPALLIADEPTSALDVTVQAEILDLLHELTDEGMSMILITHDFGVVADVCDRALVMYAGQVVEQGTVTQVIEDPQHPYTKALLNAMPTPEHRGRDLTSIEGLVPRPGTVSGRCRFANRCPHAAPECTAGDIPLFHTPDDRSVRCVLVRPERAVHEVASRG